MEEHERVRKNEEERERAREMKRCKEKSGKNGKDCINDSNRLREKEEEVMKERIERNEERRKGEHSRSQWNSQ